MKPSLLLVLLLTLLQPGLAAAQAFAPAPEPAMGADCPHAMDMAPGDTCEHEGCDCDSTCSSALVPLTQDVTSPHPRPARVRLPEPLPRTGFLRTPFRPPSS